MPTVRAADALLGKTAHAQRRPPRGRGGANRNEVRRGKCLDDQRTRPQGDRHWSRVRKESRGDAMIRRIVWGLFCGIALSVAFSADRAEAQQAFNRQWGRTYSTQDWNRFYHYPYVYYPQNFWGEDYYRSSEDMYYRYPPEMRVPVYNKSWQNYYPDARRYHSGHHFNLDVF